MLGALAEQRRKNGAAGLAVPVATKEEQAAAPAPPDPDDEEFWGDDADRLDPEHFQYAEIENFKLMGGKFKALVRWTDGCATRHQPAPRP
mmetsp:Transcript_71635/g.226277  ORF Transcript_71635/g.226277 Transcript_71635/m.226277 type:complete len:90 (-) Transcript_71635:2478-2747(-)